MMWREERDRESQKNWAFVWLGEQIRTSLPTSLRLRFPTFNTGISRWTVVRPDSACDAGHGHPVEGTDRAQAETACLPWSEAKDRS